MSIGEVIATAVAAHDARARRRPNNDQANKQRALLQQSKTAAKTNITQDKAPAAQAFGCTFVLAPSFCLKLGAEDSLLLTAFTQHPGLAMLVQSDMKVTERVVDCVEAEAGIKPAPDALLGADALLTADAQRLLQVPNAGGASRISEAFSMEVLSRAFGATLEKTEMQIVYWPASGAITDFSIVLDGVPLGVSVTRALTDPRLPFDAAAARALLVKKLGGVIRSTETCLGAWAKQLLHIWSPSAAATEALETAYATLPHELVCDTVVLVTTCEGLPQLFEEKMTRGEKLRKALKGKKEATHLAVLAESDPCRTTHCQDAAVLV